MYSFSLNPMWSLQSPSNSPPPPPASQLPKPTSLYISYMCDLPSHFYHHNSSSGFYISLKYCPNTLSPKSI